MRKTICSWANLFFNPLKLTVQKMKDADALEKYSEALEKLYLSRLEQQSSPFGQPVDCIIFSKDRALQLHALLSSYQERVSSSGSVHVLYWASKSMHQEAYDEVTALFKNYPVFFTKQNSVESFQKDLVAILLSLHSSKVFFLVDDILFLEKVDLKQFSGFDTNSFIPSLRMGMNLQRCYTLQQEQVLPEWTADVLDTNELLVWEWCNGELDWAYPLSVDGHLFSTREMQIIAQSVSFSAPNTFEDAIQVFRPIFSPRYGVCYAKSRIVNIPCNKVQVENKNISGFVDQDFLAEQWLKGKQMNYRRLYGYANRSAHEEILFDLIPREN